VAPVPVPTVPSFFTFLYEEPVLAVPVPVPVKVFSLMTEKLDLLEEIAEPKRALLPAY